MQMTTARQHCHAEIQLAHRGREQHAAHATSNDIVDDRGPGCSMGSLTPVDVRVSASGVCAMIPESADRQGSFCRTDIRLVA